jgi:hypothetical protein
MAGFTLVSKPEPCPDRLDSPGINAGQQILSSKKMGYCSGISRGMSDSDEIQAEDLRNLGPALSYPENKRFP